MEGYAKCCPASVRPTARTASAGSRRCGYHLSSSKAGLLGDSVIVSDQMCWALGHAGVCVSVHSA